jgi:serine/threonine protein kinase
MLSIVRGSLLISRKGNQHQTSKLETISNSSGEGGLIPSSHQVVIDEQVMILQQQQQEDDLLLRQQQLPQEPQEGDITMRESSPSPSPVAVMMVDGVQAWSSSQLSTNPLSAAEAIQNNNNNNNNNNRRLKRRAPSSNASSSSVHSSSDTDPLQNPDSVSLRDFEVLRNIGRGSHGTIYLVRHRDTNRLYAMKTLRKAEVLRKKEFDHTLTELSVLKKLAADGDRCPYIVPIRFAFHSMTRLFLVFEYCSGGELYYHLGKRGRIPESIAKFYATEIAMSLGYLHACGVAFRDLKPENLMLDALGHINLIDFGLCKEGVRSPTNGIHSCSGTTEYLAPEILSGKGGGLGIDWWAFGMILYEMIVGIPPWYDADREKVVFGILNSDLYFPPEAQLSNEARHLITGLLTKEPSQRIGCKGGGASEVLTHPFFRGVDWLKVARRAVEPPFVPPTMEEGQEGLPGLCNFDKEYTNIVLSSPPAKDYLPPQPGDAFDGFYFDFRLGRSA